MTAVTPRRTASSDAVPMLPPEAPPPGFTLSERTVSGLEHDIAELVRELEQLGVDLVSRPRR